MKSLIKTIRSATVFGAGTLLLSSLSPVAVAYELSSAGAGIAAPEPYSTITNEATISIAGDSLGISRLLDGSPVYADGDTIEITLTGGATFADTDYRLERSIGGAGDGNLTCANSLTGKAGSTSLSFTLDNTSCGVAAAEGFVLTGDTIAGQSINFNLPQTPGVDIYMAVTIRDSGMTVKGTINHLLFDNTLPLETMTENDVKGAVSTILSSHIRNLTSQSANLSGLLTGTMFNKGSNFSGLLGQEYAAVSQAFISDSDISLPISLRMMGGQGDFSVSLNQVRGKNEPYSANASGDVSMPSRSVSENTSPFNLWASGRWEGFTDKRGGTKGEGDFGLVMVGADYRYNADTLVGMLVQYDIYDQTATGQDSQGKGHGWMVGPYAVVRLVDDLIWDGRVAWGKAKHKINPLNAGWDNYDGERWQLETNLTGDMEYQDWNIYPQLGLSYFREEQKAFTTSGGIDVSSQDIEFGTLRFGPEVSRKQPLMASEALTMSPFAGFDVIWDFKASDIQHSNGNSVNTEKMRGRLELGSDFMMKESTLVRVKYAYDGIGLSGYESHSVDVSANMPINSQYFPNGSQLQSSFSQSIGEGSFGQIMLSMTIPLQ